MTILAERVKDVGTNQAMAMGTYHPAGTSATPMVMPLQQVTVTQAGVAVEDMQPLITEDGAMVPATSPGSWGQLRAAGRP